MAGNMSLDQAHQQAFELGESSYSKLFPHFHLWRHALIPKLSFIMEMILKMEVVTNDQKF